MNKKSKAYRRLKARFDENYINNGGSPIPRYEFEGATVPNAEQQRHYVRFAVLQLLSLGISLDEFITVAQDPCTWYPHEVFDDLADDDKPSVNPNNN
jgi:hypothetical protein